MTTPARHLYSAHIDKHNKHQQQPKQLQGEPRFPTSLLRFVCARLVTRTPRTGRCIRISLRCLGILEPRIYNQLIVAKWSRLKKASLIIPHSKGYYLPKETRGWKPIWYAFFRLMVNILRRDIGGLESLAWSCLWTTSSYFISLPVSITFFLESEKDKRERNQKAFETCGINCVLWCFFFPPQWPHTSDGDRDQSGRGSGAQDQSQIRWPRVCQRKYNYTVSSNKSQSGVYSPKYPCYAH